MHLKQNILLKNFNTDWVKQKLHNCFQNVQVMKKVSRTVNMFLIFHQESQGEEGQYFS